MSTNLYRLHMEGDWGQDRMVFGSEESARAWAERAFLSQSNPDPEDTFEEFWEGDCATEKLEFIP